MNAVIQGSDLRGDADSQASQGADDIVALGFGSVFVDTFPPSRHRLGGRDDTSTETSYLDYLIPSTTLGEPEQPEQREDSAVRSTPEAAEPSTVNGETV